MAPRGRSKKKSAIPEQKPLPEASTDTYFEPDTSESYKDVPSAKQIICIDVAEDIFKRQEKKLNRETQWLANALKTAVSSILYNRGIFFQDMFEDVPLKKSVKPSSPNTKTIAVKMLKKNHPANIKIIKVLHDLTKPMEAKKLTGVDFGVVADPSNPQSDVYEIYRFKFYYGEINPGFEIRSASNQVIARCQYNTDEDVGYGLSLLLRSLNKAMEKLEKLPCMAGLSTHPKIIGNFQLNRKRFHHSLEGSDFQFTEHDGRPPKKLRVSGYQDHANGMELIVESVLLKDEFTMNATAMDGSNVGVFADLEVPRGGSHLNVSGVADNVREMNLHERLEATPRRLSLYGTRLCVEAERPLTSPAARNFVDTPERSPPSSV
ncbi:hypothetical protein QR680_007523 [Steinernema hermaphroditum]|uniref:HORMA domain-containing protein n=1 Tax=Steinernema hermaphroditum TaxID=289476 RepID=A0AA39IDF4_9BILA|nr:hypothetical protein QR680_007523 [Steinernema hermaphroditum]